MKNKGAAQDASQPTVPVSDEVALDTKRRVARDLLQHGPSTAAAVAERLGLTPAGVRRHLDTLLADGLLEPAPPRPSAPRGRGRPARAYRLTDAGRDAFEHAYDDLAAEALGYLAEVGGPEAVTELARRRLVHLEEAYRLAVAAVGPDAAPGALAELLSEEGYAASVEPSPLGGVQMCQHHCPVAHVAAQFPQLCEAETDMIGRLLGTHVQRLATIAHGDGVCTTHIPARDDAVRPARPADEASADSLPTPLSPTGA